MPKRRIRETTRPSSTACSGIARRRAISLLLFVAALLVVVLIEQGLKTLVRAQLPLGASVPVVGDTVRLTHVENPGVAFGLLAAWPAVAFVPAALIVLALTAYVARSGALPRSRVLLLGVIAGGGLGNLVDRMLAGHVTDFIDLGVGAYRWPSFNGADTALMLGVAALLALCSRPASPPREPAYDPRLAK